MAEIRDMRGNVIDSVIDEARPEHPEIVTVLSNLKKINKDGRMRCLMAVYLTPEGYGYEWAWDADPEGKVGLTGIGALAALQNELMQRMRAEPENILSYEELIEGSEEDDE